MNYYCYSSSYLFNYLVYFINRDLILLVHLLTSQLHPIPEAIEAAGAKTNNKRIITDAK
jgi:hypothetical protein